MELKLKFYMEANFMQDSFNCTFMELKSTLLGGIVGQLLALIVPLWN